MMYAILRTRKIKTAGALGGLNAHLHRLRPTANADADISWQNESLRGNCDLLEEVRARLSAVGCKIRKNAVLAVEHVLTFSPSFVRFHKQPEAGGGHRLVGECLADETKLKLFCAESMAWLDGRYGHANVVHAVLHLDEMTPHIHAVVVPIDERDRLNCRSFLGGVAKLQQMQTDFAEHLAPLGLVRGVKGSRARHQNVKRFYGFIQAQARGAGMPTAI